VALRKPILWFAASMLTICTACTQPGNPEPADLYRTHLAELNARLGELTEHFRSPHGARYLEARLRSEADDLNRLCIERALSAVRPAA